MRNLSRITLATLAALVLASCSRAPDSVRLSLGLHQGMEHTTRFSIQEKVWSAESGTAKASGDSDMTSSLTYRFRVISTGADGVAGIQCRILSESTSLAMPEVKKYLKSLMEKPFVVYVDREGRLMGSRTNLVPGSLLSTGPLSPAEGGVQNPAIGDLGVIFGGLNGRQVSVGTSWTTPVPSAEASGLSGNMVWTVEAIGRSTTRLAFEGTIENRHINLPGLPPDEQGIMTGTLGGFVVIETSSCWPIQGKSVAHTTISLTDSAGSATRLASVQVTTLFDPAQ